MKSHRNILIACILLTGGCWAGCYNPDELKSFLNEPRRPANGLEYRVYPPDMITITSRQVPEITGTSHRIRPDGKINLPLLGEVSVAGKTPAEIEQIIGEKAKDYYEQVDVTCQVAGYNSQFYYVFGQVSGPGPKPWTGRDTLLDALAKSSPNNLAWDERIIVLRGDQPNVGGYYSDDRSTLAKLKYRLTGVQDKTPNRPRRKMTINLKAMIEKGDLSNNILLMPGDVIYVQPSPLAKVGLEIQKLLFPVNPVLQTVSVPAQAAGAVAIP